MKTGPDTPSIVENESRTAKHKNGTQRPPNRRKGAQIMKTGPNALGTAENEFGTAKQENCTRRPRNRRK
jgi:hypothetical protein